MEPFKSLLNEPLVQNLAVVLQRCDADFDDPSEYVRRSVANNINDIAKDHPEWVARLAERWMQDASETRQRLLRHACRTLIKQGHAPTLAVFGYQAIDGLTASAMVSQCEVALGELVEISCSISAALTRSQPIVIDYRVHHQKANGSTTGKVFKWKTTTLKNGETLIERKKHSLKRVTTRVYYPGFHRVEVLVNGEVVAETGFELVIPN